MHNLLVITVANYDLYIQKVIEIQTATSKSLKILTVHCKKCAGEFKGTLQLNSFYFGCHATKGAIHRYTSSILGQQMMIMGHRAQKVLS